MPNGKIFVIGTFSVLWKANESEILSQTFLHPRRKKCNVTSVQVCRSRDVSLNETSFEILSGIKRIATLKFRT